MYPVSGNICARAAVRRDFTEGGAAPAVEYLEVLLRQLERCAYLAKGLLVSGIEDALRTGDVIVFFGTVQGTTPITHRVVLNDPTTGTIITKGDANPQNDPSPVKYTDILGKKVLSVPMLGYIAAPMATIFGKVAMGLVIIGAYILTVIGARLRRV